jgi:hypothetical protein
MKRDGARNLVALGVGAAVLATYLVFWFGVSRKEIGRSDFTSTYVGAYLWSHGHHADLYDRNLQTQLHSALIAPDSEGNLPFVNPPLAAVVAAPLTAMRLDTAYRVFGVIQMMLLIGAVLLVALSQRPRGQLPDVVLALAIPGTLALVLLAQWDGLSAFGLAAGYVAVKKDRRGLGGFLLAATLLLAKPHLALGLAVFLLAWRDRRVILGACGAAALVVVLNFAAVGPSGVQGFFNIESYDADLWPLSSFLGFNGFFDSWLHSSTAAQALGAACSLLALAACAWAGYRTSKGDSFVLTFGVAAVLSLVASPHLLTQDLVLLSPIYLALTPRFTCKQRWSAWGIIYLCSVADRGNQDYAPPGRLVPIALAAIAFLLLRQIKRGVSLHQAS